MGSGAVTAGTVSDGKAMWVFQKRLVGRGLVVVDGCSMSVAIKSARIEESR